MSSLLRRLSFRNANSHSKRASIASFKKSKSDLPSAPPTPIHGSNSNLPDVTSTMDPINITKKINFKSKESNEILDSYVNDIAESSNFWEVGHYKKVIERCDNGHKLANDLKDMLTERAKIEEAYANSLKQFHKKWTEHLRSKSCKEYETGKDSWQAFLNTANKCSEIHLDISKRIISKPVVRVKEWDKKNYEKKMFSFKVTSDFEVN